MQYLFQVCLLRFKNTEVLNKSFTTEYTFYNSSIFIRSSLFKNLKNKIEANHYICPKIKLHNSKIFQQAGDLHQDSFSRTIPSCAGKFSHSDVLHIKYNCAVLFRDSYKCIFHLFLVETECPTGHHCKWCVKIF